MSQIYIESYLMSDVLVAMDSADGVVVVFPGRSPRSTATVRIRINVGIILTDGKSNNEAETMAEALAARKVRGRACLSVCLSVSLSYAKS